MKPCVDSINISKKKGQAKRSVKEATLKKDLGVCGDVHAQGGKRQISILSKELIEKFNEQNITCPKTKHKRVKPGDFAENITTSGLRIENIKVGDAMRINSVLLAVTQRGKECHNYCDIFKNLGSCIMPREGIFCKVLASGTIKAPAEIKVLLKTAVVTLSDRVVEGVYPDRSGQEISKLLEKNGNFSIEDYTILRDSQETLKRKLIELSDANIDIILTTGGTGLSPRDVTPQATASVIDEEVAGFSEIIRVAAFSKTKNSILSRGISGIRKNTLIINLPGSRKAVRESLGLIIEPLIHGVYKMKDLVDG